MEVIHNIKDEIKCIANGYYHNLALTYSGSVFGWGLIFFYFFFIFFYLLILFFFILLFIFLL